MIRIGHFHLPILRVPHPLDISGQGVGQLSIIGKIQEPERKPNQRLRAALEPEGETVVDHVVEGVPASMKYACKCPRGQSMTL